MATQKKQVYHVLKTFDTNSGLARAGTTATFKKDVDANQLESMGYLEKARAVKAVRTNEKAKADNHQTK